MVIVGLFELHGACLDIMLTLFESLPGGTDGTF